VKLLFDQNLSPRLVRDVAEGFVIVSKDADFHQRSLVLGHPPKVIWIRLGNCSTDDLARLLRCRHDDIVAFGADQRTSFLALA
jgi:predicted nuclease of predicted toxin-antitoxin system